MGDSATPGYTGKYVLIDLTSHTYEIREFEPDVLKNFIGGPALGAKMLYDLMPAKTPWDAPDSMIGVVTSPPNATGPHLGSRFVVVSKSPVTNLWNDSNCGGSFGPKLRKSGFDAAFIKGISEKPAYIFIDDGEISFHDASHLWGMKTEATEKKLREELGDKDVGILLIGPAGERRSNIAAIMSDTHRAAGRGGPGAIMGSKNLKALVCRGDANIEVYSRDDVDRLNKEILEWSRSGPLSETMVKLFNNYGTGGVYASSVFSGDAFSKNWKGTPADYTDKDVHAISSQEMNKIYKARKAPCKTCTLSCSAIYKVEGSKYPFEETSRPEYETIGMLGAALLNSDPEVLLYCNYLCNEYGFDTISFGGIIAWLMECYENNVFSREELGGADLTWGNADAIGQIAEMICDESSEMGRVLIKGAYEAARHFDRGMEYVMHACGIEAPQHDPRYAPGLARTYQYDPTPGRHVKGGQGFLHISRLTQEQRYDYESPEVGQRDVDGVIYYELLNISGLCMFHDIAMPPDYMTKYLYALTGFDCEGDNKRKLCLRSYTMRHAFNLREGMRREDTSISGRLIGKPPMTEGPHTGITVENEKLADLFFSAMDWDVSTMVPSKAALTGLGGLENVIAEIYG